MVVSLIRVDHLMTAVWLSCLGLVTAGLLLLTDTSEDPEPEPLRWETIYTGPTEDV